MAAIDSQVAGIALALLPANLQYRRMPLLDDFHVPDICATVTDDQSLPWIPFSPIAEEVSLKCFRLDPVRGQMVILLKAPPGAEVPRHHHSGGALVYTIEGSWKPREDDWIAGPRSLTFVSAGQALTPRAMVAENHVLALCIIAGDIVFLDADDKVVAIENWRSTLKRYQDFCSTVGILPRDLAGGC